MPTPINRDAAETALFDCANQARVAAGISPLTRYGPFDQDARWFAEDAVRNNIVGHTDSQGRDFYSRMRAFDPSYNGLASGENMATGSTPELDCQYWHDSPEHYHNLTNPKFTRVGVGWADTNGQQRGIQTFGAAQQQG
jgi:uncharacterized protein YkwD